MPCCVSGDAFALVLFFGAVAESENISELYFAMCVYERVWWSDWVETIIQNIKQQKYSTNKRTKRQRASLEFLSHVFFSKCCIDILRRWKECRFEQQHCYNTHKIQQIKKQKRGGKCKPQHHFAGFQQSRFVEIIHWSLTTIAAMDHERFGSGMPSFSFVVFVIHCNLPGVGTYLFCNVCCHRFIVLLMRGLIRIYSYCILLLLFLAKW